MKGDDFYYTRVGQRCFKADPQFGFSSEQIALAYALETNNIYTPEEVSEMHFDEFIPQGEVEFQTRAVSFG